MMLSVIIPTYNSASFILKTFKELTEYLENSGWEYELLFVDDGSRDDTVEILEKKCADQPRVRLFKNGKNRGKGYAVRQGMQEARGEFMIFSDADLAYPPSEIGKILETLRGGADLAIATRVASESRFIMSPEFFSYLYTRHVGSRLFNWLVRKMLELPLFDTQAGLKGFQRGAKEILFQRQTLRGFTFDVELLFVAHKHGLIIREVPVFFQYFTEATTISFVTQAVRSFKDLISIRKKDKKGVYQ